MVRHVMATTRRHWLTGFALVALVVAGCGDSAAEEPTRTPSDGSCAFSFNHENLAMRAWAFDGTIKTLGTVRDARLGDVPGATFTVNRWYRGGSNPTVTVQFEFPTGESYGIRSGVGKRLLVSGEARWGGEPLDNPVAWGCGFTREWTETESQNWATAFA
jgi:hypothetical protein